MNRKTFLVLLLSFSFVGCSIEDTAKQKTQSIIASLNISLDTLYLDIGRYPSSEEGLQLLSSNINNLESWNGPYNRLENFTDAQSNKFLYKYNNGTGKYIVYSAGVNGVDENGKGVYGSST